MTFDLQKLSERAIRKLSDVDALDHIAHLIDHSTDAGFARGARRALTLLDELETRPLQPEHGALACYYRANAWAGKAHPAGHDHSWAWEQPETQQQLLALCRAASHDGFHKLDRVRRCQILINRGNLLNAVGRFIDALESWDAALRIIPRFAVALGNRGNGLKHYASTLDDSYERAVFILQAFDASMRAVADDAVVDSDYPPAMFATYLALADEIAEQFDLAVIRAMQNLDGASLGRSKRERAYRHWSLSERLFLNPINDLGAVSVAARDTLALPGLTEVNPPDRSGLMPPIIGFFNQMKQEYVAARFMLFEGIDASGLHFADRDVLLFNTLDYPSYSIAMEHVRASYRIAYSLLDKIAFAINEYWSLGKSPERINFRNIWLVEDKANIHPQFINYENWPLRGLFWLSKEIFDPDLKLTTNPDARDLHELRNHLEHKYLQVHEAWATTTVSPSAALGDLGRSISSTDMQRKALRVMKIARSALCYLALAIGREERLRGAERPEGTVMPMLLSVWEDDWKRSG